VESRAGPISRVQWQHQTEQLHVLEEAAGSRNRRSREASPRASPQHAVHASVESSSPEAETGGVGRRRRGPVYSVLSTQASHHAT
jgi:hypothetical protein